MTEQGQTKTEPAYWYVVAALFVIAGLVVLVTSRLAWLGIIACAAGVLWAVLGLRAARRLQDHDRLDPRRR